MRFKGHGLAPWSAADFAFLLHGRHYLKEDGVMAIVLPHGVLFLGGAEERIRTKLLKDGHVDTVIGLPANLFYSTGIPICRHPSRARLGRWRPRLSWGEEGRPKATERARDGPSPAPNSKLRRAPRRA
jgi:hypothetical protein